VAAPPTTSAPVSIASDGTNLVWADSGLKEVLQIPVTGGTTTLLSAQSSYGGLFSIALGSGKALWTVYTSSYSQLWAGTESQVSSGAPVWNSSVSNTFTYAPLLNANASHAFMIWQENNTGNINTDIYDVTLSSGSATPIANSVFPYGFQLATDGTYLFYTSQTLDGVSGSVTRYTLSNGATATINYTGGVGWVACDASNAYFLRVGIESANKNTFSGTQTVATNFTGLGGLVTDGTNVYVIASGVDGSSKTQVAYVPVSGGSLKPLSDVSMNAQTAPTLAVAGGAVYWIDAGNNTIYGLRYP
jgi:hypothetical protein